MIRQALYFVGPGRVEVREESLAGPGPGQVLVKTQVSAISPGTEMLLYRDLFPSEIPIDATIPSLAGTFHYPLKYGYANVGRVVAAGSRPLENWLDRLVFAFHPHESHFLAGPEELLPVPPGLAPELAVLLPNMETAVTFMLDGAPLLGEQVVVFGQGIVGLLLTSLLAKIPLAGLMCLDLYPRRRLAAESLGADVCLDPSSPQVLTRLRSMLPDGQFYGGADLVFEVSGHPAALDQAIGITGFHGRIIVGSWYGRKKADLNLGGAFHRSRIRLVSSQVSSISPELAGRWSKPRLLGLAWRMLADLPAALLITQRFDLAAAPATYALLDEQPGEAIQVLLTY